MSWRIPSTTTKTTTKATTTTGCSKIKRKGKGQVHPRTGHEGTEGEYRYSSILPLTSALDGGGGSGPRPAPAAIPGPASS